MVLESGTPGDKFYIAEYHFEGDGDIWGAYATLMYQNGKLNTKVQKGLMNIER